jgi:hypothetical protein
VESRDSDNIELSHFDGRLVVSLICCLFSFPRLEFGDMKLDISPDTRSSASPRTHQRIGIWDIWDIATDPISLRNLLSFHPRQTCAPCSWNGAVVERRVSVSLGMAGEIFDPHALLMKLRHPHNSGHSSNEFIQYDRRLPPPFPDQIPRPGPEARPDVILEMESEINELTSEIARLRSANKNLVTEKKLLETQLMEQKERSDDVIAKLRSQSSSSSITC